jgi:hypothetical protein
MLHATMETVDSIESGLFTVHFDVTDAIVPTADLLDLDADTFDFTDRTKQLLKRVGTHELG